MNPSGTVEPESPTVAEDPLSRRGFLGRALALGLAASGGAAALAACGGSKESAAGTTTGATVTGPVTVATAGAPVTTTVAPSVAPITEAATSTTVAGKLTDIEHVVILLQENRSFDHYFGTRAGVAGFANAATPYRNPFTGHPDGYLLPYRYDSTTTAAQCGPDPDHSWDAQHRAWNGGANDGFAAAMGARSLGYFTRADLPYYWALADEFTLCDHSFCSVLGPTNPNRHMAMTGTIDPSGAGGGPAIDNSGTSYRWETYPERLQAAGVSWRVYHEVDDFDDNNLKFFAQFQGLTSGNPLYDNALVNRAADAFETDAAAGTLPQVSWLVAPTAISEHPEWAPSVGEHFTASKIAAVMNNPTLWAKTVFILGYDENGGFFDHLAPPTPPAGTADEFVGDVPIGLGFRVPTIVVSPWTRRPKGSGTGAHGARVATTVFDHTSILRFLETRFEVEAPLISAWRRATCGDLSTVLDLGAFDPSVPTLPDTAARAAAFAAPACGGLPPATVPTAQAPAVVES